LPNAYAVGGLSKVCNVRFTAKELLAVRVIGDAKVEYEVSRADDPIARRDPHRSLPRLHLVDYQISGASHLIVAQVVRDDVVILVRICQGAYEDALLAGD
jgi:hypothetical protein